MHTVMLPVDFHIDRGQYEISSKWIAFYVQWPVLLPMTIIPTTVWYQLNASHSILNPFQWLKFIPNTNHQTTNNEHWASGIKQRQRDFTQYGMKKQLVEIREKRSLHLNQFKFVDRVNFHLWKTQRPTRKKGRKNENDSENGLCKNYHPCIYSWHASSLFHFFAVTTFRCSKMRDM